MHIKFICIFLCMFGLFTCGDCIKIRDWTRVEEDCRKAIQLDHNSVKV